MQRQGSPGGVQSARAAQRAGPSSGGPKRPLPWGALRLLPAALLVAPLGSALGRLFEAWSDPCERTAAAWRNSAAGCLLLVGLATVGARARTATTRRLAPRVATAPRSLRRGRAHPTLRRAAWRDVRRARCTPSCR